MHLLPDEAGRNAELLVEFHVAGREAHRRVLCEWARSALELEPSAGAWCGSGSLFISPD
jgi:hypothetical protein